MSTQREREKAQKEAHRRQRRLSAIFNGRLSRRMASQLKAGPGYTCESGEAIQHLSLYR